jgi:4-amino-4-deoxy-L-arabinose transferase-like glycosyltransferase
LRFMKTGPEQLPPISMEWKKYLNYKDIRFWLSLLFIVRLYAITIPPLEFQHPWRQADGLMIARNFYETDPNIFFPRVDTAGEKSGITGSEFPILNYLIYMVSLVFGYQDWYGRLIVLIFSTLGSFYFYKSIRKFFEEDVAFYAAIILTASYWFSYSRKIFPDCFSAGLCLMALYFVLEYLENGKRKHLLFYLFLGAVGCLSKISSALLLSALAIPIFFVKYPLRRKMWTSLVSSIILLSISGWYFLWVPYLNESFGYGDHFTTGCPLLSMGWEEIKATWRQVLRRLYIVPMKYLGFAVFIGSLLYVLFKQQWAVFSLFIIPYLCFLFIILKTGKNVVSDQYYVLCVIPVMAFISGFGLGHLPSKKIALIILMVIAVENIGDQINEFRIHKMNKAFENLEAAVDSVSNRQDLFVINSGPHCPTAMYAAHRKGWTVWSFNLVDQAFMNEIKGKGCKFVLVCKKMYGDDNDIKLDLPQIFESADFRIYTLE